MHASGLTALEQLDKAGGPAHPIYRVLFDSTVATSLCAALRTRILSTRIGANDSESTRVFRKEGRQARKF